MIPASQRQPPAVASSSSLLPWPPNRISDNLSLEEGRGTAGEGGSGCLAAGSLLLLRAGQASGARAQTGY